MQKRIKEILITTFSSLSRATARKKIYSRKARLNDRPEIALLLAAIAESEAVQARRLFNTLRGQIDISDQYISTIFESEIEEIIEEYSKGITEAEGGKNKAILHTLTQLRAAEKRLRSFYSKSSRDCTVSSDEKFYVCQFCGFINREEAPESCPICGAAKKAFKEIR